MPLAKRKIMTAARTTQDLLKAWSLMLLLTFFQHAIKKGVKYSIYTGDATTQGHIRDEVPYNVEKHSDSVHTRRSLVSKLYSLRSSQKFPGCSQLSVKVIRYLGK